MTVFEAKAILGLREEDVPTKEGLASYKAVLLASESLSKATQMRNRLELKAIKKLEECNAYEG